MTHPELIALLRTRQGNLRMSNRQLAIRSGITPGGITRIMCGERVPGTDVMLRICDALGLDVQIFEKKLPE